MATRLKTITYETSVTISAVVISHESGLILSAGGDAFIIGNSSTLVLDSAVLTTSGSNVTIRNVHGPIEASVTFDTYVSVSADIISPYNASIAIDRYGYASVEIEIERPFTATIDIEY